MTSPLPAPPMRPFPPLLRWLAVLLVTGCSAGPQSSAAAPSAPAAPPAPAGWQVEEVAAHLEVPWGMAFLPDGRLILSERGGRLQILTPGGKQPGLRVALPPADEVAAATEAGALDLTLHPQFRRNRQLYLVYTYEGSGGLQERVVRYVLEGAGLTERHVILEGIPAGRIHSGSRLSFGPDGKLYISTGDTGRRDLAQDPDSLAGKILRLNDDGSVPPDNPFYAGSQAARSRIWSLGHRNPQGLAWDPGRGRLFATEHGPSGRDEINLIERGRNYGWPLITGEERRPGMVTPLLTYTPAIAPAGATFYTADALPALQGSLLVAALRGERIQQIRLQGSAVQGQQPLFQGHYGRIRTVLQGPEGYLYFATSNCDGRGDCPARGDRILRVVPGPR